jgi:quercetin dioxygenase-like cupin family protein
MGTILSALAVIVLIFNLGSAWGQEASGSSRVFVLDESRSAAVIIEKPEAKWIKHDPIKSGTDSKGIHIATLYAMPSTNVQMAGFRIEKGGFIAPHKSPGIYPMYVAAGQGRIILKNGVKLDIKTGDVFVHMPNTDHGYENTGDGDLIFVYLRYMPVIK